MTQAYPLQWPVGWPRTKHPSSSRFRPRGLTEEAKKTVDEIQRLGGKNIVISTNAELRRDGLPYSGRKVLTDAGVAVYFTLDRRPQCVPCDRWWAVEENLHAIWKSIEALRSLERWGAKSFVSAAFTGFVALPNGPPQRAWWEVLGVGPRATKDEISAAYRNKAKLAHADVGGSDAAMSELNVAREHGMRDSGE